MSLGEGDELELTRRRLEEQIKAKVEADLFRYYRNVGSAIVAVLGLVGFTVGWPAVQAMIISQIQAQVSEPVRKAKENAESAADAAEKIATNLESKQTDLDERIGALRTRFADVSASFGESTERLGILEEELDEKSGILDFVKKQQQTDPVTRDEIEQLREQIVKLATQTTYLAEASSKLAPAPEDAGEIVKAQQSLQEVADAQQAELAQSDTTYQTQPRTGAIAYVQFAGNNRADIEAVSEALRQKGWAVPKEELVRSAAKRSEVRYFNDKDSEVASLLATDTSKAISAAGFTPVDIQVKRLTVPYKVSSGVLELWIEIPERS